MSIIIYKKLSSRKFNLIFYIYTTTRSCEVSRKIVKYNRSLSQGLLLDIMQTGSYKRVEDIRPVPAGSLIKLDKTL